MHACSFCLQANQSISREQPLRMVLLLWEGERSSGKDVLSGWVIAIEESSPGLKEPLTSDQNTVCTQQIMKNEYQKSKRLRAQFAHPFAFRVSDVVASKLNGMWGTLLPLPRQSTDGQQTIESELDAAHLTKKSVNLFFVLFEVAMSVHF
ncbi:hypothetical protein BaRGS_00021407 [Batillaria attramentaria]|uniref:Uncharacterized protein n=1 Tax=Batillaria attramentaria TaxID=370345 RepID=A0ABD0KJM2_9CAEN